MRLIKKIVPWIKKKLFNDYFEKWKFLQKIFYVKLEISTQKFRETLYKCKFDKKKNQMKLYSLFCNIKEYRIEFDLISIYMYTMLK